MGNLVGLELYCLLSGVVFLTTKGNLIKPHLIILFSKSIIYDLRSTGSGSYCLYKNLGSTYKN